MSVSRRAPAQSGDSAPLHHRHSKTLARPARVPESASVSWLSTKSQDTGQRPNSLAPPRVQLQGVSRFSSHRASKGGENFSRTTCTQNEKRNEKTTCAVFIACKWLVCGQA